MRFRRAPQVGTTHQRAALPVSVTSSFPSA